MGLLVWAKLVRSSCISKCEVSQNITITMCTVLYCILCPVDIYSMFTKAEHNMLHIQKMHTTDQRKFSQHYTLVLENHCVYTCTMLSFLQRYCSSVKKFHPSILHRPTNKVVLNLTTAQESYIITCNTALFFQSVVVISDQQLHLCWVNHDCAVSVTLCQCTAVSVVY